MPDGVDGWPAAPPAGGPPVSRREILWIASLTMAVLVVVVILFVYDPDADIVDIIERARPEITERVEYLPGNFLDPPEIRVHLRAGVDEATARQAMCPTYLPLVRRNGSERLEIGVWASGEFVEVQDWECRS